MLVLAAVYRSYPPQPGSAQAGAIEPLRGTHWAGGHEAARLCSSRWCGTVPAPSGAPASGFSGAPGPGLARSVPVSISIPAIGVRSRLLYVGLNPDGTIQVPPLDDPPLTNEAAWYKYSPTPGQVGPSIIVGHVDSAADGPSVFFRLGALRPGEQVQIILADHQVAVFMVTGVRVYPKDRFPTRTVYGTTSYPALRLITCGGSFDEQSHHYDSNVVAFASLVSSHPA
jgi:hypothetical protein